MIEGAVWRRWVYFRIPLLLFIIVLLFQKKIVAGLTSGAVKA